MTASDLRVLVPPARQLILLQSLGAAAAYTVAMALRFLDEGSIPTTYAARAVPWAVLAGVIYLASAVFVRRVSVGGRRLPRRPGLRLAVTGCIALVLTLLVNYAALPLELRLPLSVAVIGPLLSSAVGVLLEAVMARRSVGVDQLLPRSAVDLGLDAWRDIVSGKRVLITGAAGSIGCELARQVLQAAPTTLTLLDTNETGLFDLDGALTGQAGSTAIRAVMADVTDSRRMRVLFQELRPDLIFHAAAYKHVPLVETNPEQGFTTNVLGTWNVCDAALEAGAQKVVVISTDKAVNPSSFMGLTKRVAELIAAAYGQLGAGTAVSAVRFGNVLGSRGSVVPTLLRQIEMGQPITITDRDVQRFFMTITEAASLVLCSAAQGEGGSIYVLDMGEELKIVDLAERLVRLKGLKPGRDVPFVYTGLRPGEKLREELAGEGEELAETIHPRVRVVRASYRVDGAAVLEGIRRLEESRRAGRLRADDYAPELRSLIAASMRMADPSGTGDERGAPSGPPSFVLRSSSG